MLRIHSESLLSFFETLSGNNVIKLIFYALVRSKFEARNGTVCFSNKIIRGLRGIQFLWSRMRFFRGTMVQISLMSYCSSTSLTTIAVTGITQIKLGAVFSEWLHPILISRVLYRHFLGRQVGTLPWTWCVCLRTDGIWLCRECLRFCCVWLFLLF